MRRIIGGVVLLALAACSPAGGSAAAPGLQTSEATTQRSSEPAVEAAHFDEALQRPACPARVDASQYPGPELIGLRLGMTLDEAVAVASCERKEFHIETEKRFFRLDANGEEIGPQMVTLRDGERSLCGDRGRTLQGRSCRYDEWIYGELDQVIQLATPGLPGQQRLLGIWRFQRFAENPPTVEATVASLIERFGTPTRIGDLYGTTLSLDDIKTGERRGEEIDLYWAWDASGAAFTAANPRFHDCAGKVNAEYHESQSWTADCGLTVTAKVERSNDNAAVAASFDVGLMNQQVMWQTSQRMEQHYKDAKKKAQQEEVERAKKADGPDL